MEQRCHLDERLIGDRRRERDAGQLAVVLHPAQLLHQRASRHDRQILGERQPGGVGEMVGLGEHLAAARRGGDEQLGDIGARPPGDHLGVEPGPRQIGLCPLGVATVGDEHHVVRE